MDFKKKGWLQRYLEFRKENPLPEKLPTRNLKLFTTETKEELLHQELYCFLQPTGLLYGFPVNQPFKEIEYPKAKYFDSSDRAQLIFMECLFSGIVAALLEKSDGNDDYELLLDEAVDSAYTYFEPNDGSTDAPESNKKNKGSLESIKYDSLEKYLERKVHFKLKPGEFSDYFHNSLLFIDIFFCIQQTIQGEEDFEAFHTQYRVIVLECIAAAAHSNQSLESQERKIFQQFLSSSDLNQELKERLNYEFETGIDLDQIEFVEMPWLLKRYIYELSLLTLMSDHEVDELEHQFLDRLRAKLSISEDEHEQSYTALESFLFHHDKDLYILNKRPKLLNVTSRFQERIGKSMIRNKDRLQKEIVESRELYQLLIKSRTQALTKEEKEIVRQQLIDILKTLPLFVIIALPGTFMTLPILLKLLPKSFYPTAFQD